MKILRTICAAAFLGFMLLLAPLGSAFAVILDNWNVQELQDSDDYVDVTIGTVNGNTTLTVQWIGGTADTSGAIGIDKLYYNCSSCGSFDNQKNNESGDDGAIIAVYIGSILPANEITSDWELHFGALSADGFGNFSSRKNQDSAGTGGITDPLIFVLNGLIPADFIFTDNANSAMFAVHVRYNNDCSGWASDGNPGSRGSEPNCAAVPEPSSVALLGIGILIVGFAAWRRRRAH